MEQAALAPLGMFVTPELCPDVASEVLTPFRWVSSKLPDSGPSVEGVPQLPFCTGAAVAPAWRTTLHHLAQGDDRQPSSQ